MAIQKKLQYGTTTITYSLEYSDRKTLGIKVNPASKVLVTAPINTKLEAIETKLKTKAQWILQQQAFFLSFHPLTPERLYVSGETHLYLGRQYRLKITESKTNSIQLKAGYFHISTTDKRNKTAIEQQLKNWYTAKALLHFKIIFENCLPKAKVISDIQPNLKIQWLQKRWGSCSKNGTILLNTELIKAPKFCIEYVILHEICHLVHYNHGKSFYQLLSQLSPDWQIIKDKLEHLLV